jgi:hypothetical protein
MVYRRTKTRACYTLVKCTAGYRFHGDSNQLLGINERLNLDLHREKHANQWPWKNREHTFSCSFQELEYMFLSA